MVHENFDIKFKRRANDSKKRTLPITYGMIYNAHHFTYQVKSDYTTNFQMVAEDAVTTGN